MKRLIAALVLILFVAVAPITNAQSNSAQGLEISPPLQELSADPGNTVTTNIKVRNVTQEPLEVTASVNDFVAAGEDGQPKLLLQDGEQSPYSIKDWVTTISKVNLQPGEQQSVSVTLRVPENASPGGHYGVVRFSGTSPGLEGSGVSLSASVGSLILVNVAGDIVESAQIVELFAAQNGQKRTVFEYGPLNLVERIENTGNIHFKPSGTVRVTDLFNREVGSFALNEQGGNILPGSIRKFEQTLDKKLLFGRYKIQADVVYGSNQQIISQAVTFWVIPYKLIAVAALVIVLIIFGFKRYNKFIVKRAQKSGKR